MLYFFKPRQRIRLFIRVVFRFIKCIAKYYHLSDKNYATRVFPIPYYHPNLRRFPVFAVVWYNGTRRENFRIGNVTLSVRVFRIVKQNSAKLKQKKNVYDFKKYHYDSNLIWRIVSRLVDELSHHRITLDASRLV